MPMRCTSAKKAVFSSDSGAGRSGRSIWFLNIGGGVVRTEGGEARPLNRAASQVSDFGDGVGSRSAEQRGHAGCVLGVKAFDAGAGQAQHLPPEPLVQLEL